MASGSLVALSSGVSVTEGPGEADAEGVAFGGAEDDDEDDAEDDAEVEAEDLPDGPEARRDVVVVAVAEEEARPLAVDVDFLAEGDGRAAGTVTAAPLVEVDGSRDGVEDVEFPLPERPLLDCPFSLEVVELPGISVSGAKGVPPMKAAASTVAYPRNVIPATTPARRNRRPLRPEESTNTGPSGPAVRTRRRARRAGSARPSATGCDFMTAR
ncbi:hypothetical protein [Streptomyces sp. ME19-01-6]|uniref:hypothetical protein n=1 Tax=Streptomyces sp. ME19-01-6 TaxID=3028686 RepID=UPI0029BB41C0|nr:hypothetical protein [Streptomyces sp. ME19-01-6]MDX3229060.1 hypothetical protein [Streptomyces sp. ME19-01-6]